MNLVAHLRHHLVKAGMVSAAEEPALTIAVSIGDTPRHPLRLTRRYVVTRPDGSTFSVKFIPQPWPFDVAHVLKAHAQYARCTSFRVPRLTAHFAVSEGYFFVEENLGPAPTLAQLVEQGTVSVAAAAAVIRSILGEIWETGRKPTEAFVRQEKARYRTYLLRFVAAGMLADVTADCLDRLIDEHRSALRRVWSSGDIIDKNILRVGDSWVLVDFEYSHETLFFFKEAFRSILNSAWARDLALADVCSYLGEFPEPAARLLSLLWERQLYSLVLDAQAQATTHASLRDRFWQVLDTELVVRNDQRLSALQQERQLLRDSLHAQNEQLRAHATEVEHLQAEARRLSEENARLRNEAAEGTEHTRHLEGEVNRLQVERDNLQGHERSLAAECDRLHSELDHLHVHARTLVTELDRLREVDGRAQALEVEIAQLHATQANAAAHAQALEAQISRQLIQQSNLQTRAHDLGAEVVSARNDARASRNQVHALEVVVETQRSELARAARAALEAQEAIGTRDAAHAQLTAEAASLRSQVEDLQSHLATRDADLDCERQAVHDSTRALAEREQTLALVFNSWSWRLTRPLRWVFDHLRGGAGPSPAQLTAGLVSSAERRASSIRYHVEAFHIEAGDQPETRAVRLHGWCFAPSGREPVVLEVRSEERMLHRIVCDLVRDDVAAAHPEDAARSSLPRCGFDATVAVERGFTRLALWSPAHATTLATLSVDPDQGRSPSGQSGPANRTLEYQVEKFRVVANPFHHSKFLEISGWCFATERRPPVRLELRADGHRLLEWRCDRERPDVAAGFHSVVAAATSSLPLCGFDEVFPLVGALPNHLELVSPDDSIVLAQRSADQVATREPTKAALDGTAAPAPTIEPVVAPIARPSLAGRPLRIACFTHNLNLEGATKVVLDTAVGLRSRRHFEPLVFSPFDGSARPSLESHGIPCSVFDLPGTASLITGWTDLAAYRRSVEIISELLQAARPDIVMANVLNSFYVIEACSRAGIPSLWSIHESYSHATMLRSLNAFVLPDVERAFALAHAVVFVSRATCDLYKRYNTKANFHVIYNALRPDELSMLRAGPGAEEARRRLGAPNGKAVILSVGTVCARKDQATLARALGLLAQRRDDFHAYLVGAREGDPYVRMVEQLIRHSPARGHVEVVRETHDVHAYYRAADIFAFSSLSESYPLVILEAMAQGLPIVTTNCTGVSEQVEFGANALGFDFTDAEGLAAQLDLLLADRERRHTMAQRSRELFANMSTYEEMIDQYEALVRSAVQPSRAAAAASAASLA